MLSQDISSTGLALREAARRAVNRLTGPTLLNRLMPAATPGRLLIAPKDLRTTDPSTAQDIYAGRFFLAGKLIETGGRDPFTIQDAPRSWQRELHAFGWFRHLEADGSALPKQNAAALLGDWLNHRFSRSHSIAWEPETAARRLITWFAHSVGILEAITPRQYQQWLKSIGFHIRFLKHNYAASDPGLPRLLVRIALAYVSICVDGQQQQLSRATRLLDAELAEQLAEDGMHVSRNPAVVPDLLSLLLPLRQSHASAGIEPSPTLVSAIDRLMLAMKFFVLGDGTLARFNGMSATRSDLLATLLQYDDSPGNVSPTAAIGGYQRLAAGDTVLLADTGSPPSGSLSRTAHAGTLAFGMSSGDNLVVVNCGAAPLGESGALARLARATAAHSTVTINDTSSSRIYSGSWFAGLLGTRFVSTPGQVTRSRIESPGELGFSASHDGYFRPFGIVHQRTLKLSTDGNRIEAVDQFTGRQGQPLRKGGNARFAIRFHLHPSVSAGHTAGSDILLMCGNGRSWRFICDGWDAIVDESVFFASVSGARRTTQIVLEGDVAATTEVRWRLVREQMTQ